MKNLSLTISLLIATQFSVAQSNTFPTSGNVGIGTTSPNATLQIGDRWTFADGGQKYIGYNWHWAGGNVRMVDDYAMNFRFTADGRMLFQTAPYGTAGSSISYVNALVIDSNGRIGVGVDYPLYTLQILTGTDSDRSLAFSNSDDYITNSRSCLFYTASGSGTGIFQNAGNLLIQPRTSAARGIYFNTSDGTSLETRLSIDPSGYVGIGVIGTPDAKLAVKGDIHAQEVRVDLTGSVAPDYVFDKDYKLPSLLDVQLFIAKYKHLPEVPSANEMKDDGIKLKEMNLMLLKKVEELTLYVINLQQEIDELKANEK